MTEFSNTLCGINQMDRMTYGRIPKHIEHYKVTGQTPDDRKSKEILENKTTV
jgi:hypothetical protein